MEVGTQYLRALDTKQTSSTLRCAQAVTFRPMAFSIGSRLAASVIGQERKREPVEDGAALVEEEKET